MTPPTRHLHWDAEGLWLRLRPLLPDLSVEVVARTDSTNTRLLERARHGASADRGPRSQPMSLDTTAAGQPRREGEPADAPGAPWHPPHGRRATDLQPCLLVAEHQTQGRGRLGRSWQATPGLSLTFSLALPYAPAAGWSGLSLAVGLALAQALEPQAARPRLRLKWPNDLWLAGADGDDRPGGGLTPPGRKLGGILLETLPLPSPADARRSAPAHDAATARWLVVGVGLNVRPQPAEEGAGLTSGHASLQELRPDLEAPAALHAVAVPLVQALLDFARDGFAPLQPAYAQRDLLAGRPVSTTQADCPQGRALGVDADGALRVQASGPGGPSVEHRLLSGEVSVRPLPEGPTC